MFAIVNELHFKDGDYIFKEGTYGDWIYIINSGEVEISKVSKGQKIVVEVLKTGEIFGEMAFIDKTPRSASAIARGRVSVGILDREQLDYEFNKLSTEVRTVVKALVNRLRQTTNRISALSGRQDLRAPKALEIQFKTARDFKKAYSVNIGGGGILLRTEEPVTMGTKCDLRFNLPGESEPIETDSQVVWASLGPDGEKKTVTVGLKFVDLKENDKQRIASYVDKVLSQIPG